MLFIIQKRNTYYYKFIYDLNKIKTVKINHTLIVIDHFNTICIMIFE